MSIPDLKILYLILSKRADDWLTTKSITKMTIERLIVSKRLKSAFLAQYLGYSKVTFYEKMKTEFNERDYLLLIELFGNFDELTSQYLTDLFIEKKLKL